MIHSTRQSSHTADTPPIANDAHIAGSVWTAVMERATMDDDYNIPIFDETGRTTHPPGVYLRLIQEKGVAKLVLCDALGDGCDSGYILRINKHGITRFTGFSSQHIITIKQQPDTPRRDTMPYGIVHLEEEKISMESYTIITKPGIVKQKQKKTP